MAKYRKTKRQTAKQAARWQPLRRLRIELRRFWHWFSQTPAGHVIIPVLSFFWIGYLRYWRRNLFHKIFVCVVVFVFCVIGVMYGIARWYMWTQSSKPLVMGATFIPDYAKSFGLDPKETMDAMLDDLQIKQLRLVSYWDKIEPTPGKGYDFSELDWEFQKANDAGAKVSLAIGLRQPRWPECHMPDWAKDEPMDVWSVQVKAFMKAVMNRYKDNPALQSYQLENEYFLSVFGECPDFSRTRLVDEYNFAKDIDPAHPIIISRSNNAIGWPLGQPQPDLFGVSVYKRVWDITLTKRYVEYPFPAWFYGFLGGVGKIFTGKDLIIHELQAEPWPPNGVDIVHTPLAEQSKSLDAKRLEGRFEYGKGTGLRSIDLWGAEYWYYRKKVLNDPSVWNVAKQEYQQARDENTELMKTGKSYLGK